MNYESTQSDEDGHSDYDYKDSSSSECKNKCKLRKINHFKSSLRNRESTCVDRRSKINTEFKELDKINKMINDKIVTNEQVIQSGIGNDDKIKLIEYIKILEHTNEYTEEYLKLKYKIYNIFNQLVNCSKEQLINCPDDQLIINNTENTIKRIWQSELPNNIKLMLCNKYNKLVEDKYVRNIIK